MTTKAQLIVATFILSLLLVYALPVSAEIRIMPLGGSITKGSHSGVVPDTDDYYISYRKDLLDLLTADSYEVNFVGSQSSGSAVFADHQHQGIPGIRDDEVAVQVFDWLVATPADIVLIHVGTNQLNSSPADVEDILDKIHSFDQDLWVLLARIINRSCLPGDNACLNNEATTTTFNNNVAAMAQAHVHASKIKIVDMENGAGIDYDREPSGDMWDMLHPFETGYAKMADLWFLILQEILPLADAGSNQTVNEGVTVNLDGSNSSSPQVGMNLDYMWEQTAGTPVTLSNVTMDRPTFTAPVVASAGETLTFKLTVADADGLESTDTVDVQVDTPINSSSGGGVSGGGGGGGGGCFIATLIKQAY